MATIHMTTAAEGSFFDNLTHEIKMRQTPQKHRKGMVGAPLCAWCLPCGGVPAGRSGGLRFGALGRGPWGPEVPAVLGGCCD